MKSTTLYLVGLGLSSVFLFLVDISVGSVSIPFDQTLEALFSPAKASGTFQQIIWDFRVPRAITALLSGGALAACGLMMQTLFRNPLAGPFVLGISSGASLGVALLILSTSGFGVYFFSLLNNGWVTVFAASIGSGLVMITVLAVSRKITDTVSILIVGIMLGSLSGALVGILQYFSNAEQIQNYLLWTFGSLGRVTWTEMIFFAPVILVFTGLTLFLFKPLNTFLLGDQYAKSMGMDIKKVRGIIVIITSVLSGTVTAFCGPIAFIGLAAPHIARILLKEGNHKVLLPASILVGFNLLIICDLISRIPGSSLVLPINIVTSLIGAPLVIWLIFKNKGLKNAF